MIPSVRVYTLEDDMVPSRRMWVEAVKTAAQIENGELMLAAVARIGDSEEVRDEF